MLEIPKIASLRRLFRRIVRLQHQHTLLAIGGYFACLVACSYLLALSLFFWAKSATAKRIAGQGSGLSYNILEEDGTTDEAPVIAFFFAVLCVLIYLWRMTYTGRFRDRNQSSVVRCIARLWLFEEHTSDDDHEYEDVEGSASGCSPSRHRTRLLATFGIAFCIAWYIFSPRHSLVVRHRSVPGHAELVDPFVVPVICANRADTLSQVTASLQNARFPPNTVIVFSIDGHDVGVRNVVDTFFNSKHLPHNVAHVYQLQYQNPMLGLPSLIQIFHAGFYEYRISFHVYHALYFAYDVVGARATVVIEDDIVSSPDAFMFFDWVAQTVLLNANDDAAYRRILAVRGMERPSLGGMIINPDAPDSPSDHDVTLAGTGILTHGAWGWVTTKRQWPFMVRYWAWFYAWDVSLDIAGCDHDRVFLSALAPRTKHIGKSGVHFTLDDRTYKEEWDYDFATRTYDYTKLTPIIKWPNEESREKECAEVTRKRW